MDPMTVPATTITATTMPTNSHHGFPLGNSTNSALTISGDWYGFRSVKG